MLRNLILHQKLKQQHLQQYHLVMVKKLLSSYEANLRAVIAFREIGAGHAAMKIFTSCMNLYCLSQNGFKVRDITKLSGYPPSNVKTRLEQSNYYLASGRFPLQNAIYDNTLPFSRM